MNKMKLGSLVFTTVLTTILFAGLAAAQIPDEFKNLKVLPKDISKRDMVSIMRDFSAGLGVRCQYCHVGESRTSLEGYDFASDEKKAKEVARAMMKMVRDINQNVLPAATLEGPPQVRCVTCHRGLESPETLDRVILAAEARDGVAAAAARYRELRDTYFGKGSYDFGAGTLNNVAETLARQKDDVDGAIALVKLNLEFNPEDASTHLMLGQLYLSKGDKAAAITSFERCLQIDPENRWAKQALERAKTAE